MKKSLFLVSILSVLLFFTSCEDETTKIITFEDVALTDSIWNGSDGSGKYSISGIDFKNSYNAAWSSWTGFVFSSKKDTKTAGFGNQYSVIAGIGAAKSQKFAIAYNGAEFVSNDTLSLKSMMLTNSTYTYLDMINGSGFSKIFTTNDWFKVIITGYINETKTSDVEYYLADFQNNKSFISSSWTKVDVSKLGKVNRVTFTFDSSDKGNWGVNTPQYVCIDNIEYSSENE